MALRPAGFKPDAYTSSATLALLKLPLSIGLPGHFKLICMVPPVGIQPTSLAFQTSTLSDSVIVALFFSLDSNALLLLG